MFLDVDGVLWDFPPGEGFGEPPVAARGVSEFFDFAMEHFEVRWLTWWAPTGTMDHQSIYDLSMLIGVPMQVLMEVGSVRPWADRGYKHVALDPDEIQRRPWVWVEDLVHPLDVEWIGQNGHIESLFVTNVLEDRDALVNTLGALRKWLDSLEVAA
jgi:hypothetical protein